MGLETGHQFRTLYAFGIGKLSTSISGHQLSRLAPAPVMITGLRVGAGGIDGLTLAGGAGAEDDEFDEVCS